MNENVERLYEISEKTFVDFKARMLENSKEEIFDKNYEIRFFNEMKEFFTGCGSESLKEHTLEVLVSLGENLLHELYEEYLHSEYFSIHSWDDICEWLDIYAENLGV